jgi:hypothetical protein
MNRSEILDLVSPLNEPSNEALRLRWLTELGFQMTISARAGYPTVENRIQHLVAFNEMQHQLYNYMRHPQQHERWQIEYFLQALLRYAEESGVAGHLGAAVRTSLESLRTSG